MAYGNWGAKVWRNGKPCPERCDVPVFREPIIGYDEPGVQKFWTELLRLKAEGKLAEGDPRLHPFHCVLGDGPVRLVGYKNWGKLYIIDSEKPIRSDLGLGEEYECTKEEFEHEYKGKKYKIFAEGREDPYRVLLRLEEPDGTVWHAVSGYTLGEGFDYWEEEAVEEGWK